MVNDYDRLPNHLLPCRPQAVTKSHGRTSHEARPPWLRQLKIVYESVLVLSPKLALFAKLVGRRPSHVRHRMSGLLCCADPNRTREGSMSRGGLVKTSEEMILRVAISSSPGNLHDLR